MRLNSCKFNRINNEIPTPNTYRYTYLQFTLKLTMQNLQCIGVHKHAVWEKARLQ